MAKLGNLYISLIADTATFSSGLNKAKSDLNSSSAAMNRALATVDKQFKGIGDTIKDFGRELFSLKGAFTALVGTVGAGSIVEFVKSAVEAVGKIGDLAKQVGVSTDTLQAFHYAATQVGVSTEEMDNGLAKLTKTIGLAETGNKAAIDSFNKFGINILDIAKKGRPTDDVIGDIANKIAAMKTPTEQAAAAVAFFGKSGQQILPFLEEGAQGIDSLVQKAKDLGLVLSPETIAQAKEAGDKLATLSLVLKTQFEAALVELAPVLSAFADKMVVVAGAVHQFFQDITPDDEKDLDALERKFAKISDLIDETQANIDKLTADKSAASGLTKWLDSILPGASIDQQIAAAKARLVDYQAELEKLHLLIDQKQLAASSAADTKSQGAGNPVDPAVAAAAEKNIDKLKSKLRELQDQLASLDQQAQGTTLSKALAGLDPDAKGAEALAVQIEAVAEALDRATLANEAYAAVQKADAEAVRQFDAEMQKGKQILQDLRTPIEIYRDRVAELQQLHLDGAISSATYARGLDDAKTTMQNTVNQASGLNSAMTQLGSTWTSAFEDAALSMDSAGFSAKSLSDVLKGLLQDIERIILRLTVEDPIAKGLGGVNWGSLLFGSGVNAQGYRTTGAGPGASANTNTSGGGFFDWLTSLFHTGGIAGGSSGSRSVPALAFAGAPRLHSGGFIGPGEVPAILKRGEGVFTREQMASMAPAGGGDIHVVVNDYAGNQVTATQQTGPDGMTQLVLTLEQKLAGNIRRGGPMRKAIGDTFGANGVAQVQRG